MKYLLIGFLSVVVAGVVYFKFFKVYFGYKNADWLNKSFSYYYGKGINQKERLRTYLQKDETFSIGDYTIKESTANNIVKVSMLKNGKEVKHFILDFSKEKLSGTGINI